MLRAAGMSCGLILATAVAAAVQPTLDRRAIEEAIFVGQSRIEVERARFHLPYRIQVSSPPVDWIDVITPFHRVELAAESAARNGRRMFGQKDAFAVLGSAPDQLDLVVELTFHPLNTFVGIPSYEVAIVKLSGERVAPRQVDRYPRFTPRADSSSPVLPDPSGVAVLGGGQPILGGTLVAAFDIGRLAMTERQFVVVLDGKTELSRSSLDLGKMR